MHTYKQKVSPPHLLATALPLCTTPGLNDLLPAAMVAPLLLFTYLFLHPTQEEPRVDAGLLEQMLEAGVSLLLA